MFLFDDVIMGVCIVNTLKKMMIGKYREFTLLHYDCCNFCILLVFTSNRIVLIKMVFLYVKSQQIGPYVYYCLAYAFCNMFNQNRLITWRRPHWWIPLTKDLWCGAVMFSLLLARTVCWSKSRVVSNLRSYIGWKEPHHIMISFKTTTTTTTTTTTKNKQTAKQPLWSSEWVSD